MRRLRLASAVLGVATFVAAAFLAAPGCSRRGLDPTPVAAASSTPPPSSGTPSVPLTVRVTYRLAPTLATYPVAVWVEDETAAFVRTLGAYPGNFQYAPSYVLPTWWARSQGRGGSPPIAARPPGTYAHDWILTDWIGGARAQGNDRIVVETSNWGALWTDELAAVDVAVFTFTAGSRSQGGSGAYLAEVYADVF